MPEIVEDGVTGFIVENEVAAADAIDDRVDRLSRAKIRARFEQRFTARRMADDYVAVYRRLLEGHAPRLRLVKT